MIDIDTQMKCLKLAWVNRYYTKNYEDNACLQILHHGIPVVNILENTFWFCSLKKSDLKKFIGQGYNLDFWKEVAMIWFQLFFHTPVNKTSIENEILWLNSHIRIKKNCYKTWFEKGIIE